MPQTPGLIVVAAIVPPLVYAVLLAGLDPRRPRPWAPLLASFLWGAIVAAACATRMNDLVASALARSAGEAHARALAAIVGGPIIEELLKGAGLLLLLIAWPDRLRSVRDGILHGAWIGLGFELAENLDYLTLAAVQGGAAAVLRGMWVRGFVGGLKHAVFTGTTGAGLGFARQVPPARLRLVVAAIALLAAVAQHAAWNAIASEAITRALCGAAAPDAPCRPTPADLALFVRVPLIAALFVGPGALALLAIARRRGATSGSP